MFNGDRLRLFECESHETSFTWTMDFFPPGVYWCGSRSEISNAVNISSVGGDVFLKSPVHPVTEGQSVTLSCLWFRRTNLYSNISFYKNDELLQSDDRRKLEISAVSKSDEGFYKCERSGDFSPESWMSVKSAAPPPVLTVSPSWLTPGASGTLTCGGVPHPTAGWRFYWYRADPISLDQAPSCSQSILYGWSDLHIPDKFSYELLPGSDGGTEQNSFIIQDLTESAGYSCRAGRGDPVFYTEYSNTTWVWPVDSYSSVSLTVSPDSVQHRYDVNVRLTCEGNSDKWRLWIFTGDKVELLECESQETITSFTWIMDYLLPSGVYWCGSGSEISNAVNITEVRGPVILKSPVRPVTEGQSVTLSCLWYRRTNLDSNISFYKNDELLQSDDRRKLEISAVSKSDEGFYKCGRSGRFSPESWMSVKSAAPPPVLTVSPSWLTPGASGTLTCGGVPHPTAGWRFYWYRADPISLDQAPSCSQSILYGWSDLHIPDKFSYELLPGSDGGTEQNSFIIQDLTESAGYSCRAGRGDPVFYTEYSNTTWVWPVDSYSSVSLTVSPDSVQHHYDDQVRLTCEGNSDKWRLWIFTGDKVELSECESQETITSFTWNMDRFPSGVYWCGSGSEISNAVNFTAVGGPVILKSPVRPVTEGQSVTLSCLWYRRTNLDHNISFYKNGELLQSDVRRKLEISAVSKSDDGFYKCERSGDFSPESWMSVKLTPAAPPSASPVLLVVGLVGGFTLILLLQLLLLCWCRNSKNLCCDRLSQSLRTNQSSDPTVHYDEVQLPVYSSLLHGDDCIYDSIRGDTEEGTRGDPEETSDYVNENPHSASGGL
ncbi:uncharacterized protein LOC128429871 [Pleuronectes platessa]|uniref:uncharacterized protein LOC128429871 n=1 Tax=Pleuronectes platessa TaxID=8262 RepID=UPI00232A5D20|nr:uncharacterized protein LOC128429871 [Pleuronectes platessa]